MRLFAQLDEAAALPAASPLAAPLPMQTAPRRAVWLVVGLMLACFLPRALMGWKVDVICEDGPLYVAAARSLEQGNLDEAFRTSTLGANLYPIILMLLHKAGWDWAEAGKWWGIAMATLVVPPLFGWLRRQFNDPVAALACLLYASHPALIERTPEVLRDPTFWLLFVSFLYFFWRAVVEVRLGFFVTAGLMLALAISTRIEGCFLVIPLVLWTAWRYAALSTGRARLALGAVASLAVLPLLVVVINLTWLAGHPRWEFCYSARLGMFQQWAERLLGGEADAPPAEAAQTEPPADLATAHAADPAAAPSPAEAQAAPPAPQVAAADLAPAPALALAPDIPAAAYQSPSPIENRGLAPPARPLQPPTATAPPEPTAGELAWSYLRKMVDAFDPIYGVLTLGGLWGWRRVFFRRDQMSMFCFVVALFVSIWLFLVHVHDVIGRYFFPIVLISAPYAALGLLGLAVRLAAWGRLWLGSPSAAGRWAWTAGLVVLVGSVGWSDALSSNYDSRRGRRELGQWLRQTVGPGQLILGSEPRACMLAYYADAAYYGPAPHELHTQAFHDLLSGASPAAVVIWSRSGPEGIPIYQRLASDPERREQFQLVAADELPPGCQQVTVLLRQPYVAGRPPARR